MTASKQKQAGGPKTVHVILGVAGELPGLLPHLTPGDLAVIDRAYRDGLNRAAGGGA